MGTKAPVKPTHDIDRAGRDLLDYGYALIADDLNATEIKGMTNSLSFANFDTMFQSAYGAFVRPNIIEPLLGRTNISSKRRRSESFTSHEGEIVRRP
jgi:hypothetical protein